MRPVQMLIREHMRPLAVTLLAFSGVVACQSSSDGTKTPPSNAVDNNCKGSLNSAAINAAKSLVGSDSLRTSSESDGASGAAKELISEYRSNGINGNGKIGFCWIYRASQDLSDITISFSFAAEVPDSDKVASVFTPYKMGTLALAGEQKAVLYMECSSSRFESDGSRESFTIRGETRNRYDPDGSPVTLRERNLTVMHSASLALAKAMECKNNANLPDHFKMPDEA